MKGTIAEMRADMAEQMTAQRAAMLDHLRGELDEATIAELDSLAEAAAGDLPPLTQRLRDEDFAGYILMMQAEQEDEDKDSPLAKIFEKLQEMSPPPDAGDDPAVEG